MNPDLKGSSGISNFPQDIITCQYISTLLPELHMKKTSAVQTQNQQKQVILFSVTSLFVVLTFYEYRTNLWEPEEKQKESQHVAEVHIWKVNTEYTIL